MQIDVDFEVFKFLTGLRENESHTENDVLRNLIGLPTAPAMPKNDGAWIYKGVRLPEGTELETNRVGKIRKGSVKAGLLDFPGYGSFRTPTSAAQKVLGLETTNGWYDLFARRPGERHFRRLLAFRKKD